MPTSNNTEQSSSTDDTRRAKAPDNTQDAPRVGEPGHAMTPSSFNGRVESDRPTRAQQAIIDERDRRNAKSAIDREEAAAQRRLPPKRESYKLASYRAEEKPPREHRIERLQLAGHSAVLIARYKTGKTTLHAELTHALVDDEPFLDRFDVSRPSGDVGVWNLEMDERDYEDYLIRVEHDDRVAVWNLRGHRLELLSDGGYEDAVAWLKQEGVSYLVIDPWAKVCAANGVNENYPSEVMPLLQRIDEMKEEAGVSELLICHHTGWSEHMRGATSLGDWADSIWELSVGRADADESQRYFKASGRGVGVETGVVDLDDDTGALTFRETNRNEVQIATLLEELKAIVAESPGISTAEARDSLTGRTSAKKSAVRLALDHGDVREEAGPRNRRLLYPVDESETQRALEPTI
jgi:hypothetical protein